MGFHLLRPTFLPKCMFTIHGVSSSMNWMDCSGMRFKKTSKMSCLPHSPTLLSPPPQAVSVRVFPSKRPRTPSKRHLQSIPDALPSHQNCSVPDILPSRVLNPLQLAQRLEVEAIRLPPIRAWRENKLEIDEKEGNNLKQPIRNACLFKQTRRKPRKCGAGLLL